jgi:hypothetical protein
VDRDTWTNMQWMIHIERSTDRLLTGY